MNTDNITVNTQSSIRIAGSKILYFDPQSLKEEAHDADMVFITHEHWDHFDPNEVRKIVKAGTVIFAPATMEDKVREALPSVEEFVFIDADREAGSLIEVCEGITLQPIRSYNVGKKFHAKESGWLGYVVTMDGTSYFVAGDTDANEDNLKVRCDIALVPAGGTYTFTADEAASYVNRIKPEVAIPTHYGSVVGGHEAGDRFREMVNKDIKVVLKL